MMSERKHADLWRELVDEAGEEEIDRAANVSVTQAEAELRAAGFDVAAERAKAGAFLDALGAGRARPREGPVEAPRRKRPRPAVLWLAAAATFAVAGGAVYATLHRSPEPVAKGHPPEPSTPAPACRRRTTSWSPPICAARLPSRAMRSSGACASRSSTRPAPSTPGGTTRRR